MNPQSKAYSIDYYVEKYKLIRTTKLADGLIPRDRDTNQTLSDAKDCAIEFIKNNIDAKLWFQKLETDEKPQKNMEYIIRKYYAATTDRSWTDTEKELENFCDMKKFVVLRIGFYLKDIKNGSDKPSKQLICASWDGNKEIDREITVKTEVVELLEEKNYLRIFVQQYFEVVDGGFRDAKTLEPIDLKKFLKQKIRDENSTG